MDILEEIVAYKRIEIARRKSLPTAKELYRQVETLVEQPVASLRAALMRSDTGIIAEFKRRSPSKGWIKEHGRADIIPLSYEQNGAAALSILADIKYFGGSDVFITDARQSGVTIPILFKEFVVDEYQLFLARRSGASAVLLIASVLSRDECRTLMQTAHDIGLEVLLEVHGEAETSYAELGPDVCGVNNRNLGSFVTDVNNSLRVAELLPKEACKVSESGIGDARTICCLRQAGYNGFLVGERFMRADNPGAALRQLINDIKTC